MEQGLQVVQLGLGYTYTGQTVYVRGGEPMRPHPYAHRHTLPHVHDRRFPSAVGCPLTRTNLLEPVGEHFEPGSRRWGSRGQDTEIDVKTEKNV